MLGRLLRRFRPPVFDTRGGFNLRDRHDGSLVASYRFRTSLHLETARGAQGCAEAAAYYQHGVRALALAVARAHAYCACPECVEAREARAFAPCSCEICTIGRPVWEALYVVPTGGAK